MIATDSNLQGTRSRGGYKRESTHTAGGLEGGRLGIGTGLLGLQYGERVVGILHMIQCFRLSVFSVFLVHVRKKMQQVRKIDRDRSREKIKIK